MAAAFRKGARGRRRGDEHDPAEERWLLTYADMITLLMALFMVMFSISSVNKAKYEGLSNSLQDAFSGNILPGGKSFQATGGDDSNKPSSPEIVAPALKPSVGEPPRGAVGSPAAREEEDFRKLKLQIDAYARTHGLERVLQTTIARRGLVIRVLTDRILFDSGQAKLKPASGPLLDQLGQLLRAEVRHPIVVEGHTDKDRISSEQFPTNWELSSARATVVVRHLIRENVSRTRLSAGGYGALRPVASNATERGRSLNRRVEIVLQRMNDA